MELLVINLSAFYSLAVISNLRKSFRFEIRCKGSWTKCEKVRSWGSRRKRKTEKSELRIR